MTEPRAPITKTADSFFGGIPSISFNEKEDPTVKGRPQGGKIIAIGEPTQIIDMDDNTPKFWPNGDPRLQLPVTVRTELRAGPMDDGERVLYIKGDMQRAVREAFKAVGARGLQIGGDLYVAWVDDKPPAKKGFNPQKIYAAKYTLPVVGMDNGFSAQPATPDQQAAPAAANPFAAPAVPAQAAPPHPLTEPAMQAVAAAASVDDLARVDALWAQHAAGVPMPAVLSQEIASKRAALAPPPLPQPTGSANPFAAPAQPTGSANPFAAPAQPTGSANPFGAPAAPAQASNPFAAPAAPAPTGPINPFA